MDQTLYNYISMAAVFSMAAALFCLKKEYELFRKDVIKILGALGIMVKNDAEGFTVHVTERKIGKKQ